MRVTTDFWVSALVRRVFASTGFAAVIQRGATEAGAVFVLTRDRFGEVTLFGPAPQTSYDEARPDERLFGRLETTPDEAAINTRLERERKFDPDIWVVEVEPGSVPIEDLIAIRTS
ncbi:DUF1491 domain-containing protein [Mesorhizobium loti]|nr:DUF1491 family protein [Mesorhizobium loti]PLP59696.1 DUF1491 domain-containing protein [Mesorhizobium loti]